MAICFLKEIVRAAWSVHSWAIAIDVNAAWNAFGQRDFEMSEEFAACFEEVGFVWGGRWSKPDAMHFQYCLDR
ncbi:MAG: M15 family metallopeptidase [Thermodesulfobacteriota bacterium]